MDSPPDRVPAPDTPSPSAAATWHQWKPMDVLPPDPKPMGTYLLDEGPSSPPNDPLQYSHTALYFQYKRPLEGHDVNATPWDERKRRERQNEMMNRGLMKEEDDFMRALMAKEAELRWIMTDVYKDLFRSVWRLADERDRFRRKEEIEMLAMRRAEVESWKEEIKYRAYLAEEAALRKTVRDRQLRKEYCVWSKQKWGHVNKDELKHQAAAPRRVVDWECLHCLRRNTIFVGACVHCGMILPEGQLAMEDSSSEESENSDHDGTRFACRDELSAGQQSSPLAPLKRRRRQRKAADALLRIQHCLACGDVSGVAEALAQNRKHHHVQTVGASALGQLAAMGQHREVLTGGAVEIMISSLGRHQRHLLLVRSGVKALYHLAVAGKRSALDVLLQLGAVPLVVSAVKLHEQDSSVLWTGSRLLSVFLSAKGEHRTAVVQAGGREVLLAARDSCAVRADHTFDQDSTRMCFGALRTDSSWGSRRSRRDPHRCLLPNTALPLLPGAEGGSGGGGIAGPSDLVTPLLPADELQMCRRVAQQYLSRLDELVQAPVDLGPPVVRSPSSWSRDGDSRQASREARERATRDLMKKWRVGRHPAVPDFMADQNAPLPASLGYLR